MATSAPTVCGRNGLVCHTMSGMAAKTERIEARIDPHGAEWTRRASKLTHTSGSGSETARASNLQAGLAPAPDHVSIRSHRCGARSGFPALGQRSA
jgi:hypothetical protein